MKKHKTKEINYLGWKAVVDILFADLLLKSWKHEAEIKQIGESPYKGEKGMGWAQFTDFMEMQKFMFLFIQGASGAIVANDEVFEPDWKEPQWSIRFEIKEINRMLTAHDAHCVQCTGGIN